MTHQSATHTKPSHRQGRALVRRLIRDLVAALIGAVASIAVVLTITYPTGRICLAPVSPLCYVSMYVYFGWQR